MAKSKSRPTGRKKKRKPQKSTRAITNQAPQEHLTSLPKPLRIAFLFASRFFFKTWKTLGAVLVIVGAIQAYFFFSDRISIIPGASLAPNTPFATTFTLSNDGQFSLYSVEFQCIYNAVDIVQGPRLQDMGGVVRDFDVPEVRANDKTTAICYFPDENAQIAQADISMAVTYRPEFLLWRTTRRFRFKTSRQADGKYQWLPIAGS
jgi:hypothetical protein